MRNDDTHHVVVTDEHKVVGIVGSFDLLELLENKKFVGPQRTLQTKGVGKRRRAEEG